MIHLTKKYLVRSFLIIGSILILGYVSLLIYVGIKAESDTKVKSDVILVLGAKSYWGKDYNPCLVSRVAHAVDLYKSQYASKIIVSGGSDSEDNVNEAETMKKIAIEKGVPEGDILIEKQATSTYENFVLSKKIMENSGLKSVIIVTEPFHVARAVLVGEKVGYSQTVSPASDSQCWKPNKYLTKYFLKEPLGIILYKLKNQI